MPRPRKCRRVCQAPKHCRFGQIGNDVQMPRQISMSVDEFESIRLIDLEGLTQEACAVQMNVGRTTAQAIYNSARVKLAESLVNGAELLIEGGDYVICNGESSECGCEFCHKHCMNNGEKNENCCHL